MVQRILRYDDGYYEIVSSLTELNTADEDKLRLVFTTIMTAELL